MDRDLFTKHMGNIDLFSEREQWSEALDAARQLRESLMEEPFPEPDQLCWPLYSELRALHALDRWREVAQLVRSYARALSDVGPTNNAHAHTLAMEAAARLGMFDDFLKWARLSLELRLIDQDVASMQVTLQTARELLKLQERLDLLPELIDHLYEIARDHHETELAELAREWAGETRDSVTQHVL